ncbi:MAG: PmoA family protein [Gemmataceae bacterium]|nr:PmoA family protein [Gemmataceae bacterium]
MNRSMITGAVLAMVVLAMVWCAPLAAQEHKVTVTVASESDLKNVPVCIPLSLPKALAGFRHAVVVHGKEGLPGQLTAPGLGTEHIAPSAANLVRRDLHFILGYLNKGESLTFTAKLFKEDNAPDTTGFWWMDVGKNKETPELIHDVLSGAKRAPVLRYMGAAFDDSSKEARDRTYKVFHHLYDPSGKRLVTNGGHSDLKPGESRKLLFPHHRGIMFGFNKCTYGDGLKNKADTWHCTGDAHVAHEKTLGKEAGAVLGRHRVQIGWHGAKKERFAVEERELTAYHFTKGTLIEFASRLKTTGGPVKLDGDPQHAGFQFRASNDVADKTAKQTYYVHPDGKGAPGATRNWPQDKSMVDLPWYAMSFVLADQRYTCCYLNHPKNPKETRFSERDYGRFGGYFEYTLTEQTPLVVNYRLWLQNGEVTPEKARELYDAFVKAPKTVVK